MTDATPEPTTAQLDVAAATFDLLSVPARLHLVVILARGEFDVQTLADKTGQLLPATSQQLAKLRAAGIVAARREGRRQMYRVDDPHILAVIDQMFSHIAPDGTLAPDLPGRPRSRNPRFTATGAL
jgi:DNA-binding transcriptional ArsR family regulator